MTKPVGKKHREDVQLSGHNERQSSRRGHGEHLPYLMHPAGVMVNWTKVIRLVVPAATSLSAALYCSTALSQIVANPGAPNNEKPTVLTAGNGVPVVNIQTPTAAGVSVNKYSQFDVANNGAIINNSRSEVQSQLGGWIQGNPWLSKGEASVILNEVTSSNPSLLQGYVEIAGHKADLIIANPSGISCDGCGFVNVAGLTLTTSKLDYKNGAIASYRVDGGAVSVLSGGMDASTTDYTDIMARALIVNGGLWAKRVSASTGNNSFDPDHAISSTASGGSGAPAFALDVSALGGMYAGHIELIGTEDGVGMRNAGSIGTSIDDLIVTAEGLFDNSGKLSSATNIQTDAQGLANSGTIYSVGDVDINVVKTFQNGGTIASGDNTTLTGRSSTAFSITKSGLIATGVSAEGMLGATGNLEIAGIDLVNSAGQLVSGGDQTIGAKALDLTGSTLSGTNISLKASDGDLTLTNAVVSTAKSVVVSSSQMFRSDGASISGDQIDITATDISNVRGKLYNVGNSDLALTVAGKIDNSFGTIAANATNLSVDGSMLVNADGTISHAGSGVLAINVGGFDNSKGTVVSNGQFNLSATSLTNDYGTVAGNGLAIKTSAISNLRGNVFQTGSGQGSISNAGTLDNSSGRIVSNGGLTLVSQALISKGGDIEALGMGTSILDITVTRSLLNLGEKSQMATIWSNANLTLRAASVDNGFGKIGAVGEVVSSVTDSFGNGNGMVVAGGGLSLNAGAVDNRLGTMASSGDVSLQSRSAELLNAGGIVQASKVLSISSLGIANVGGSLTGGSGKFALQTGALDNSSGRILVSGGSPGASLRITGGKVLNDAGVISSDAGIILDISGYDFVNKNSGTIGGVFSSGDVSLSAKNVSNASGYVASATNVGIASSGTVDNTLSGVITSLHDINVTSGSLVNGTGRIEAGGNIAVDVSGTISNSNGLSRSGGLLSIKSGAFENENSLATDKGVQGAEVSIQADHINNITGAIIGTNRAMLISGSAVDNTNGKLVAGHMLSITDQTPSDLNLRIKNTGGKIESGDELKIQAGYFSGDGQVLATGALTLTLAQKFANTQRVSAQGALSIVSANGIENTGEISSGDSLTADVLYLENASTGSILGNIVSLTARGTAGIVNRGLFDGGDVRVAGTTVSNIGSGRIYGDHVAIGGGQVWNLDENGVAPVIAARGRLDIGAVKITNDVHALIFSAGDLMIGGSLDASGHTTGRATTLDNNSATIQALGNMNLSVATLRNTNTNITTQIADLGTTAVVEYQGAGSPNRYLEGTPDVYTYERESLHLHTPEGNFETWNLYNYNRSTTETKLLTSDPGYILSGANLTINAADLVNDNSRIIAGGNLAANITTLNNIEIAGQRTITDNGSVTSVFRKHKKGRDDTGTDIAAYTPPTAIQSISIAPTEYQSNATVPVQATTVPTAKVAVVDKITVAGEPTLVNVKSAPVVGAVFEVAASAPLASELQRSVVRSIVGDPSIPNNGLYIINSDPSSHYLIETDPRFADYRTWLSSDYLLDALKIDPATAQKRLGDGFYEQQLLRQQVAELTGRAFLEGYADTEQEFKGLMNNAVAFADEYKLRPGVALTKEQMAALTADIIWPVEKTVKDPSGKWQTVWALQLYVRVQPGDLDASGALMSGQTMFLNASGNIKNSATLAAADQMEMVAKSVENVNGTIKARTADLQAETLSNVGGNIFTRDDLKIHTIGDLISKSTVSSSSNDSGSRTIIDRVANIVVLDPHASLTIIAGGKVRADGANFIQGTTQASASGVQGALTIYSHEGTEFGTVTESARNDIVFNQNNYRHDKVSIEKGTGVHAKGNVNLGTDGDLAARGASITSEKGETSIVANNVTSTSAVTTQDVEERHQQKGRSGPFSRTKTVQEDVVHATTNIPSMVTGEEVTIGAANTVYLSGIDVLSTTGTDIWGRKVIFEAATDTRTESHFVQTKKSGISASGFSVSAGTQKVSTLFNSRSTGAAATTVSSIHGDVHIVADDGVTAIGSDFAAPDGSIYIFGKSITIKAAIEQYWSQTEVRTSQSAFSFGFSNPVVTGVQTAQDVLGAMGRIDDRKSKAIGVATVALDALNVADSLKRSPYDFGGVNFSAGFGSSKSQSTSVYESAFARASTIDAKNIMLSATGGGTDSNILIAGSKVEAAQNATAIADNHFEVVATKNTEALREKNSSSSHGISAGIDKEGNVTGTVSGGGAKGETTSSSTTWTNAYFGAGNLATFTSGGDTLLKGGEIDGRQINGTTLGNLIVESLQDESHFESSRQNFSGSASLGVNLKTRAPTGSISANWGQTNISSDYKSVTRQSGIRAGDGGYQLYVGENTDLVGGIISGSQTSVDAGVNSLSTGTITFRNIFNNAKVYANTNSIGIGYAFGGETLGIGAKGDIQGGAGQTPGRESGSLGGWSASSPVAIEDHEQASSVTHSSVSAGALTVRDGDKQTILIGQDAKQAVDMLDRNARTGADTSNALAPIFNEQEIGAKFEIVGAFSREAGVFLENRAKEADTAKAKAEIEEREATDASNGLTDEQRLAKLNDAALLRADARDIEAEWGAGGTYRQITMALMAGTTGNVSASSREFVRNMVVNYVQQQGDVYIGKLVADGSLTEGSPLHAALHGIAACAGAAAANQSCGSAAMGSAASSVLTGLFSETRPDETNSEREAKRNLIVSLVTGIAASSGADTATATNAATASVDNNWLATQQIVQFKKEFDAATGTIDTLKVLGKWANISRRQDVLTTAGVGKGLAQAGWSDLKGLAEFLSDPEAGINGMKLLLDDKDLREQLGNEVVANLNAKLDRMSVALQQGGDDNAEQLGKDLGELIWQVGMVATTVGGVAKTGVQLSTVGIKVGAKGLEKMANMAKLGRPVLRVEGEAASVWKLGPGPRGEAIEQAFGHNLPNSFPVVDKFSNGVATSIKSLDLNAASYLTGNTLKSTLTRYVDKVADYAGTGPQGWAGVVIKDSQITSRELEVIVPRSATVSQQKIIDEVIKYGASLHKPVNVKIIVYP